MYRNYCNILVNIVLKPKLSSEYGAHLFFLKYIKEGDKILDIGCNRGDVAYYLASRALSIDAYDISRGAIALAKKNRFRPNINYIVQDADSVVSSTQKHYDVAVIGSLLTFLEKPDEFLIKLRRVADLILIRETKFDNDILVLVARDLGIKKSNWKEFSKRQLTELITNCGYTIVEDFDTYDMFFAAIPNRKTES